MKNTAVTGILVAASMVLVPMVQARDHTSQAEGQAGDHLYYELLVLLNNATDVFDLVELLPKRTDGQGTSPVSLRSVGSAIGKGKPVHGHPEGSALRTLLILLASYERLIGSIEVKLVQLVRSYRL